MRQIFTLKIFPAIANLGLIICCSLPASCAIPSRGPVSSKIMLFFGGPHIAKFLLFPFFFRRNRVVASNIQTTGTTHNHAQLHFADTAAAAAVGQQQQEESDMIRLYHHEYLRAMRACLLPGISSPRIRKINTSKYL